MCKLDLHGVRHGEVREELINFIEGLFRSFEGEVEVVTGHSPKMRAIVMEVLEEYGYEYHIGGWLGVKPAIITFEMK
jgi:DNA-nicking Smr family endonuclease